MTDSALTVIEQRALSAYSEREEVRELADRLLNMHPAATEVGAAGMRAAAQLALLLGANPLPGVNEVHIWKDKQGRTCMSLGVNYWRRKAQEWGGVLFEIRPRQMRPEEAKEYGIPANVIGSICRGVRAEDMLRFRSVGFTANDIWDMCGATGVGTVNATDYAKQGRPLVWTANKRAETDLLRQLFPAQFSHVAGQLAQAPVTVLTDGDDAPDPDPEPPARRYTLADANRDLFSDGPDAAHGATDGEWTEEEPPAPQNGRERLYSDGAAVHPNVAAAYDAYIEAHDRNAPANVAQLMSWYRSGGNGNQAPAQVQQAALLNVPVAPDTPAGGGAYQE